MEETKQRTVIFKQLGTDGICTVDLDSLVQKNYSFDKEQIINALNKGDTSTLREMSAYFYTYSGVYRQIVHKIASIHYYRSIVTPEFYLSKNDKFNEKIDKEVMKYYRSCKVDNTCYNIGLEAILYGSCCTYETVTPNGNVIQQVLPAEYCRTRSKDEFDNNIVEFNFRYFDNVINQMNQQEQKVFWKSLPKEFENLYKNYKANKSNCNDSRNPHYQRLDSNYARCTMSSLDGCPLFANMFPDILDYEDYKTIDSDRAKQKLFKLIVQKFNLDDSGEPVCGDEQILSMHRNLNNAVDGVANGLTTPFEVTSVSLDDKAATNDIRYAEQSIDNLYNSGGIQQAIMGSLKGANQTSIKSSNTLLSSSVKHMIYQYENWYTKKLNEISKGKVIYSFKMLDIHVFNESDVMNGYKQQLDLGGSLILYTSAVGINQTMYQSLLRYENEIGIKDMMKPLINSNQASASDINEGSNKKDDKDKTDESIRTDENRG